jgi:hypothetical protein
VVRLYTPASSSDEAATKRAPWRLRIELVRGWVHALAIEDPLADKLEDRRSEAELDRLALLGPASPRAHARAAQLLAAATRAGYELTTIDEPRRRQGSLTPFHPLPILRDALTELFSTSIALAERLLFRPEFGGRPPGTMVTLTSAIHASSLAPDEQALVALLLRQPRTWQDLAPRMPPPRFTLFLRDLVLLGALALDGDPTLHDELRALARDPGPAKAKEAARKRAYHAEARALHPDLHSTEGTEEERKARAQKLAELTEKHRRGE